MLGEQQDAPVRVESAFRLRAAVVPSSAKVGAGGHRDHPARGPGRAGDLRAGWCELREPAGPAVVLRADRDPGAQHAGAAQALPGAAADPRRAGPVLHQRRRRSLRHPAASRPPRDPSRGAHARPWLPGHLPRTNPGGPQRTPGGRHPTSTSSTCPTAVHLHGGHTPRRSSRRVPPADLVSPFTAAVTTLPDRPAGGHPLVPRPPDGLHTARQVYLGLAGFHLVHDDEEDRLPLPEGDRDVPLMIADRAFRGRGRSSTPRCRRPWMAATRGHPTMGGVLGDVVLVNGAPWPVLDVDAVRYRLRLLNASNARRYRLAPDRPGGRRSSRSAPTGAAGRAGGARRPSISRRPSATTSWWTSRPTGGQHGDAGQRPGRRLGARCHAVPRHAARQRGPRRCRTGWPRSAARPGQAVRVRDWRFRRGAPDSGPAWVVNGRGFDPQRMDATPRLGEVEIWRFSTDVRHPVHVHLDPFQVLARNGGHPPR